MSNTPESQSTFSRRTLLTTSTAAAVAGALGVSPAAMAEAVAQAPASPGKRASLTAAQKAVQSKRDTILKLSREVWEHAELGLGEAKSMAAHLREIAAAGFTITHRRAGGHPSAFVAEWKQGTGGPVVGFLPEYDALPGLGNQPVAEAKPTANGNTSGHGCGHNCLGAAATGAALALKAMMESSKTPGTVRIYGCGAEETQGAKVYMTRAGLFSDVDAILNWHPAPVAGAGNITMTANRGMKILFRGKSAHAGNTPWDGRSALDALELCAHGLNLMREHVEPTARIHYVFEQAGVAPNVVPDEAQINLKIREKTSAAVVEIEKWVRQIAEGAALATQTQATVTTFIGVAELIPNDPLARRLYEHIQNTPLDWSPQEQAFAREVQKSMGVPEAGLATRPIPFIDSIFSGGSTDVGDVSWQVPVGQFGWPTFPLGVSLHTWAVTACGGMAIGDRGTLAVASILAAAGFDALTEPALIAAAKADLQKRTAGRQYVNALDPNQKEPINIPAYMTNTGEDDISAALDDVLTP